MRCRCPHCHAIFDSDNAACCCQSLRDELARLQRSSQQPSKSLWLWHCQHTVEWMPARWIEISNLATMPGHYYSWWCNCNACHTVRTARGFTYIQRERYQAEVEK